MAPVEIFVSSVLCILLLLFFLLRNWPFLIMMPTMYLKPHEVYDKITQLLAENNATILFKTSWFTKVDILVTSDPANVQHIMNSKFSIYQRGSEFRNVFDFLGEAVFNKDLDVWRQEKKYTHAFFKEDRYHKSTPRIIHHTLEESLIPVLDHMSRENQVFDMQELFTRYMLDATCIMVVGSDPGSLQVGFPQNPLLNAMDDIGEAVFYRHILPEKVWKLQRWLNIGKEKKMADAAKTFGRILDSYVSEKRKSVAKISPESEDFDVLQYYLTSNDNFIKDSIIHEEKSFLASNLMTLLFAGRDTSGALLTWFFYLISRNPLAENKILQEIRGVLLENALKKHIFSNVEELSKLVYFHSAICESLRLFPTGPFLLRVPNQKDVLPSGHKVSHTTKVMLCSYGMGRMPEIWGDDCREFKPERWLSEKGGMKHVASSNFLAFSSGPWTCPGRELAFTRMKAVAATIMHNFRVSVLDGQNICPSVSAILTMKHGLKAKVSDKWM